MKRKAKAHLPLDHVLQVLSPALLCNNAVHDIFLTLLVVFSTMHIHWHVSFAHCHPACGKHSKSLLHHNGLYCHHDKQEQLHLEQPLSFNRLAYDGLAKGMCCKRTHHAVIGCLQNCGSHERSALTISAIVAQLKWQTSWECIVVLLQQPAPPSPHPLLLGVQHQPQQGCLHHGCPFLLAAALLPQTPHPVMSNAKAAGAEAE